MKNQNTVRKISNSVKTIEKKIDEYIKNQEKMITAIKEEIISVNFLLSELDSNDSDNSNLKGSSRKKSGSSPAKEPVDYIKLYEIFMSERTSTAFSDVDNSLNKFIIKYPISSIQDFCDANGIILKVSSPKNKLYGKIITAITENKRF